MIIKRFGTDARCETAESILGEALKSEDGRLFLFPIPSSPDGVRIKGGEQTIRGVLADLRKGDIAVGYGLPETGGAYRSVDVADDETFTEENARLTADAALGVLLTEKDRAPLDLTVGVIGYGRIGRELVRLLLFLGADVRVYSENAEKREELCSYGIECKESVAREACGRFRGLDALFNTAPAPLVLPEEAEELSGVSVYELASGENLPKEVTYKKLPSLPEKTYPESAGKIYARAVLRMLRRQ